MVGDIYEEVTKWAPDSTATPDFSTQVSNRHLTNWACWCLQSLLSSLPHFINDTTSIYPAAQFFSFFHSSHLIYQQILWTLAQNAAQICPHFSIVTAPTPVHATSFNSLTRLCFCSSPYKQLSTPEPEGLQQVLWMPIQCPFFLRNGQLSILGGKRPKKRHLPVCEQLHMTKFRPVRCKWKCCILKGSWLGWRMRPSCLSSLSTSSAWNMDVATAALAVSEKPRPEDGPTGRQRSLKSPIIVTDIPAMNCLPMKVNIQAPICHCYFGFFVQQNATKWLSAL